jgi:hypothetical protein
MVARFLAVPLRCRGDEMRTRDLSLRKVPAIARWALPAALSTVLFGCPNQELAPLTPCTVSGVSLEVPQSGVDKVDMLFMIDNSGSMSQEQKKLADALPKLVAALATGNKNGMPKPAGEKSDFPPVQSLHIGVVTSDMGINGAPSQNSCGDRSFIPTDKDTRMSTMRINKPVGDDGILQIDTGVAVAGIWSPPEGGGDVAEVVPGDPACGQVTFPGNMRFVDFMAGGDAMAASTRFSCIAKRGRNGCGLEQQLESVLKALTPPDSNIKFTAMSPNGHGNAIKMGTPSGFNQNFLREDSILAVVVVSDEEDCSIPDQSRAIFDGTSMQVNGGINVRCGLPENQGMLHPVSRFIDGIKALKPAAYQDRLIFTAIAGIPLAPNLGNMKVHSGAAELQQILDRPDMKFSTRRNASGTDDEPVPTCISESGDGSAAPGRRYLEVAKAFGANGVVTSICEDEYLSLLGTLIDKIAAQLTGACLPRKLSPDPVTKKVDCVVVEIQAAGYQPPGGAPPCDPAKGRIEQLPNRRVNGTDRTVCLIDQVAPTEGKEGWFYDDSSKEVKDQCKKDPQRIAFTGNGNPPAGAQAKFECFQPVQSNATEQDMGRDAVNLNCAVNPLMPEAPSGEAVCGKVSGNAVQLICVEGACQIQCQRNSQCPAGWECVSEASGGRAYCVNPTCPSKI